MNLRDLINDVEKKRADAADDPRLAKMAIILWTKVNPLLPQPLTPDQILDWVLIFEKKKAFDAEMLNRIADDYINGFLHWDSTEGIQNITKHISDAVFKEYNVYSHPEFQRSKTKKKPK